MATSPQLAASPRACQRAGPLLRSAARSLPSRDSGCLRVWTAMREGLLGDALHSVHRGASSRRPVFMLDAGLDLSRNRLDVCLLFERGELVEEFAVPSDHDGVRGLARRVLEHGEPVRGVVESMTGARFVHDTLERHGWDVLIADAQRVKGLAPLACKTDKIDARVWRCSRSATWCRRSGCPTRRCAASASRPASGCTWSSTARCSSTASTRR